MVILQLEVILSKLMDNFRSGAKRLIGIEILDNAEEATRFELRFDQAPHNKRSLSMLKAAFPMLDPKATKIFFKIKSLNPDVLGQAMVTFYTDFISWLTEKPEFEDLKDEMLSINVSYGIVGNSTILLIQGQEFMDAYGQLDLMLSEMIDDFQHLQSSISLSVSFAKTLQDLLDGVNLIVK